ncbi:MAG TPA: primosomal protein N' [Firmicutes bacterium]|nr:primosomal protein N' [Bacillota bacterium]
MLYLLKVLLRDGTSSNDKIATYKLNTDYEVGFSSRVIVRYKMLSQVFGFVFECQPIENDLVEYPFVTNLMDERPLLESEKDLIFFASSYYKVGIFEVLSTILPFNGEVKETRAIYFQAVVPPPLSYLSKLEYELYRKVVGKGEVLASSLGQKNTAAKLVKKGYLRKVYKETESRNLAPLFFDYSLDEEGKNIVEKIENSSKDVVLKISDNRRKFEVYRELIAKRLKEKKSVVLILKSVDRNSLHLSFLRESFKEYMVIFDRVMSNHIKVTEQKKLLDKEAVLVIGTPEIIFYSIPNLDLIICDSAESMVYKMKAAPHINFRKMALEKEHTGKIIMSCYSPTISLRARVEREYYDYIENKEKQKSYKLFDKSDDIFSPQLIEKINEVISKGKQVVIYHSTRGYAPIYKCHICSTIARCPTCDVPLTYYKDDQKLVCLQCGYKRDSEDYTCERCGGDRFDQYGFGTMKIAEKLEEIFPDKKIARLDNDIAKIHEFENELTSFALGYSQILVGNQIVSANLYMPKVDLIIIMDIDWILNRREFDIEEKTYNLLSSLLSQVNENGEAILLTNEKENNVINLLAKQDYDSYYNYALNKRKLLKDPPYYYIVDLVLRGYKRAELESLSSRFIELIRKELEGKRCLIVGPSPISYLGTNRRYSTSTQIKYKDRSEIDSLLERLKVIKLPPEMELDINIDPYVD